MADMGASSENKDDKGGMVYFSMLDSNGGNMGWHFIDPHEPDFTHFFAKFPEDVRAEFVKYHSAGFGLNTLYHTKLLPDGLQKLCYYECVYWDNKIYFVGGRQLDPNIFTRTLRDATNSKKVFSFDIVTCRWVNQPELNIARSFPTVVAAGKKLHVFGGFVNPSDHPKYCIRRWGESLYLDSSKKHWKYIPFPPAEDKLAPPFEDVSFHVVYERRHQILLWFQRPSQDQRPPRADVYAYDYISEKWVEAPSIGSSGPLAIHPPVIVGDVLIWHYFGNIFCYDLINQQITFSLNIPDAPFGEPLYRGHHSEKTFLLPVGRSKLCLIWYEPHVPNHLYCYRFLIKTSSSEPLLHGSDFAGLECDGYAHLPVDGTVIGHAVSNIIRVSQLPNNHDRHQAASMLQRRHRSALNEN